MAAPFSLRTTDVIEPLSTSSRTTTPSAPVPLVPLGTAYDNDNEVEIPQLIESGGEEGEDSDSSEAVADGDDLKQPELPAWVKNYQQISFSSDLFSFDENSIFDLTYLASITLCFIFVGVRFLLLCVGHLSSVRLCPTLSDSPLSPLSSLLSPLSSLLSHLSSLLSHRVVSCRVVSCRVSLGTCITSD
jgi:hypothetical protein